MLFKLYLMSCNNVKLTLCWHCGLAALPPPLFVCNLPLKIRELVRTSRAGRPSIDPARAKI